jgi:oligopeptide/dipeptide ABC transporter ATP-binding protein
MTPLLEVRNLCKTFRVGGGMFGRGAGEVRAVEDVSFTIGRGRTFGLVGESGCGKSTLGRAVLRLHEPSSGSVLLDGEDVTALGPEALLRRRADMQIIFQDPYASLSPRRTVGQTLLEPLELHRVGSAASRQARIAELLDIVGLPTTVLDRYPHEFSGGQRQRIGIARALALQPRLIVADEPVSALDVSVQSQVLNLIADLQREFGISFLFISHDLAVVQHVSHDIGVMYAGRLVEVAPAATLYAAPRHPYTEALISAVPVPDPAHRSRRILLDGDVPSPLALPPGCPFHTRCPRVLERCRRDEPSTLSIGDASAPHLVRCHLHAGLARTTHGAQ